jgi:hypothetical protein
VKLLRIVSGADVIRALERSAGLDTLCSNTEADASAVAAAPNNSREHNDPPYRLGDVGRGIVRRSLLGIRFPAGATGAVCERYRECRGYDGRGRRPR